MKRKAIVILTITMLSITSIMFGLFSFFGTKSGDLAAWESAVKQGDAKTIYQFTVNDIDGKPVPLADFRGKVILIVNVASKCGYTPQYEDLQKFYEANREKGVVILAFPANNFLGQEPGTDAEIKEFCSKNYGVTFPVFSKISVKGNDQAPLYKFLTSKEDNGVMDTSVKWNFQKYLIDREGRLVTFFSPGTKVTDPEVTAALNKVL